MSNHDHPTPKSGIPPPPLPTFFIPFFTKIRIYWAFLDARSFDPSILLGVVSLSNHESSNYTLRYVLGLSLTEKILLYIQDIFLYCFYELS